MSEIRQSRPRQAAIRGRWWLCSIAILASLSFACASDEEKVASHKAQAETYVEQEMLREAVIEYRNVLQIDPNDVDAHRGLAKAYLSLNSVSDAYWELSETIRLDPSDRDSRNTYAAISLANGRYEIVLEQADALIAADPYDEVGLVLQAQAYERLGREDEVEPLMRKVIEAHPDKTEYRLLLSNFFLRAGRSDEALAEAEKAMEIKPSYSAAVQLVRLHAPSMDEDAMTEKYLRLGIDLAIAEHAAGIESGDSGVDNRGAAYEAAAGFMAARKRRAESTELLETASETLVDAPGDRLKLMYMLSGLYRDAGDEENAARIMNEAAASDEGNPDPLLILSTYRTTQKDYAGALEASDQALAIAPDNLAARLRHAEALIEYGSSIEDEEKMAQGRTEIDAILAAEPGLPEGLFLYAKVLLADKDYARAVETISAALEAKPDWPQARLLHGTALMGAEEYARARVEIALALELDPNMLTARRSLTRIHAVLNEHEYAVDQGRIYLAEKPLDAKVRIIVAQSLIRLGRIQEAKETIMAVPEDELTQPGLFALARIELGMGNFAEARRLFELIEVDMPHHVRVLESFLTLDRMENRLGDSEKRISAAVEAEPENAELRRLQGLYATLKGDLELAETSYQKAIELDPKMFAAYENLAMLYNSQGRVDDTIAIYEKAVEADPQAAGAHHSLAVLYEMTGKREQARQHYGLAIELDNSRAESKNNLAYMLASDGSDLDQALTLAQEAKAAMPGNPNTADTLGYVLLKRGVPSAAIGYFREALANLPEGDAARGEVGYHLGLGYVAAGQKEEAAAALKEALGHLDRQLDAAQAAGDRVGEPPWASQARAELEKLEG